MTTMPDFDGSTLECHHPETHGGVDHWRRTTTVEHGIDFAGYMIRIISGFCSGERDCPTPSPTINSSTRSRVKASRGKLVLTHAATLNSSEKRC